MTIDQAGKAGPFRVRAIITPEAVHRYRDRIRIMPVDLGSHHFHVESPGATARLLADVVSGSQES